MSVVQWQEVLSDRAFGLAQVQPYPVAAPHSVEALQEIMKYCAEFGYRVLPMGSGSSFPPNFALRSERTFAISLARLKSIQRTTDGLTYCQAGVPVRQLIALVEDVQRVTVGGLLCGFGDSATRRLARAFWQLVRSVVLLDSRARPISFPGPAAASYVPSQTAALLLESRGKAGILAGVELVKRDFPIDIRGVALLTETQGSGKSVLARQPYLRALDPTSLFDW